MQFYWVESAAPPFTQKIRKSQKKLAHIYVYIRAYTQIRDRGGRSAPPALNRVKFSWRHEEGKSVDWDDGYVKNSMCLSLRLGVAWWQRDFPIRKFRMGCTLQNWTLSPQLGTTYTTSVYMIDIINHHAIVLSNAFWYFQFCILHLRLTFDIQFYFWLLNFTFETWL